MKIIKVLPILLIIILASASSYAHNEKDEYNVIAKAIEARLKEEVDSKTTPQAVKEHSTLLLKEFYKTQKIGRFWVNEAK
jgi:hypothetical protein